MGLISGTPEARKRGYKWFFSLLGTSIIGLSLKIFEVHLDDCPKINKAIEIFEDFSVHIFAAAWLYVFLDVVFKNVSHWYGRHIHYNYDDFVKALNDFKWVNETKFNEVIIVNTFLKVFIDRKEGEHFIQKIVDAINKGAKVKILLLDPFSFSARQRKEEIDDARKKLKDQNKDFSKIDFDVIEQIIKTINFCSEIEFRNLKYENALDIRLYDRIPPFSLFKIRGSYYMGFYPASSMTTDEELWTFYEDSKFSKFIMKKFNDIWHLGDKSLNIEKDKYNNTFLLKEYFKTSFLELDFTYSNFEQLYFVDAYNCDSGFINDKKVFAVYIANLTKEHEKSYSKKENKFYEWVIGQTNLHVRYKGQTLKTRYVENISTNYEEILKELELVSENNVTFCSYCKNLFNLKYSRNYLRDDYEKINFNHPFLFRLSETS